MRRIALIILIGDLISLQEASGQQYAWIKHITLDKTFSDAGSISSYVRHVSAPATLVGYWDRASIYSVNGRQIEEVVTDSNTLQKNGSVWGSAGTISFSHSLSAVCWYDSLYGSAYITVMQYDSALAGVLSCNVMRRKENRFERVTSIKFGSKVDGIVELGDSMAFIWGVFYEAQDKHGTRVYNGAAIWDMKADTLGRLPSVATANQYPYGLGSITGNRSYKGADGTILVLTGNGYGHRIMQKGSTQWKEDEYPPFPTKDGGRITAAAVIDKDHLYLAWQKDSSDYPCYLLQLKGDSLHTIARFTSSKAVQNVHDNWINSITVAGSRVYIVTTGDVVNGVTYGHIVSYDTASNVFKKVSDPSFEDNMQESWTDIIDGRLCLFETNGNLIFHQAVYTLRDTATVTPTITGPVDTQTAQFTVTGTARPGTVLLYEVGVSSPHATTAGADSAWAVTFSGYVPGTYQFYATAVNDDGWESQPSSVFSVRVSAVTAIDTVVPSPIIKPPVLFPNPAHESVTVANATRLLNVYAADGRDVSAAVRARRNGADIVLDISRLSTAMYIISVLDDEKKQKQIILYKW